MKSILIALLIFSFIQGWAKGSGGEEDGPFWTGTLLTTSAKVIPPGHINVEPYLFDRYSYAAYDGSWKPHSRPTLCSWLSSYPNTIGFVDKIDLIFTPRLLSNHLQKQSSTNISDTTIGFGYQALEGKDDTWVPYIRLIFKENLPTGKYDRLNPVKLGVDATGIGSYATTIGFLTQNLFDLGNKQYLRVRINSLWTGFMPVKVKGVNVYGGGFGAKGTVYPRFAIELILGLEYSMTKNWVASLDLDYVHAGKITFKGFPGINSDGSLAAIASPSADLFSLAPGIEYNFNENIGIIGAIWFSFAGRNSTAFYAPSIALNLYY